MTSEPIDRDEVSLRITLGATTGFVVWDGDRVVCGFSTAAELALWIEDTMRQFDPPREVSPAMPSVARPAAHKQAPLGKRIFGVVTGKD